MQVVAAAAMEAPSRGDADDAQGRAGRRCSARSRRPTRRTTSAASTTATARSTASPPDSTTETYAALRLDIENWRWAGVPFFIRTGKRLPVTQTELRLVFKQPAAARLRLRTARSSRTSSSIKLDPSTGIRLELEAHRADARGAEPIKLDMEFAEEGGEGPTPYEVLLHAAIDRRQHALHPPGRRRGDVADHAAAARRAAAGAPVRAGLWGPGSGRRARRRPRPLARTPGSHHEHDAGPTEAAAERGRAVAVPADRGLRVPVRTATRARSSRPTARSTGSACPRFDSPSVFGSLLDRQAGFFRFGPFGINHPTARAYEPGTNVLVTTWKTPSGWVVVRDALTIGPRDHEDRSRRTRGRRPTTTPTTCSCGRSSASTGSVEVELVCEPAFDYGRTPAEWTLVDGDRHAADATGAGQTIRLRSDLALGIEGDRVRARHVLEGGRPRLLRALVGRGARGAGRRSTTPSARIDADRRASGAPGWAGRGSPTIAGATRSSARRSRSRA